MRSSKVLYKEVAGTLSNSSFSSTILYPYNPEGNAFVRLPYFIYTKYYLSQFVNQFPDFKASEFPAISIQIYKEFYEALQRNNRSDLLKCLTPPKADIIKIAQKHKHKLPFEVYENVVNSSIVHARISAESATNSTTLNFAHITAKMEFLDLQGQPKIQYNVFERRLDNQLKYSWKIGFINDYP